MSEGWSVCTWCAPGSTVFYSGYHFLYYVVPKLCTKLDISSLYTRSACSEVLRKHSPASSSLTLPSHSCCNILSYKSKEQMLESHLQKNGSFVLWSEYFLHPQKFEWRGKFSVSCATWSRLVRALVTNWVFPKLLRFWARALWLASSGTSVKPCNRPTWQLSLLTANIVCNIVFGSAFASSAAHGFDRYLMADSAESLHPACNADVHFYHTDLERAGFDTDTAFQR